MQKFRTLFTFTLDKETVKGEETTQEKLEFCLQRPTRAMSDDAELFYNVTVSRGIQAGLLSAALLAKRFNNDGGILSEGDKKKWADQFLDRMRKELALQRLTAKGETRSPEEQTEYDNLVKEIAVIDRELQEFEIMQQSLFDVTAEARARTRTILWWLLFLLNKKNAKGEWEPFFDGKTLDEKQESYDALDDEEEYPTEEERKFAARVVTHAIQAITLWYYGRATDQKAFEAELKATGNAPAAKVQAPAETPAA